MKRYFNKSANNCSTRKLCSSYNTFDLLLLLWNLKRKTFDLCDLCDLSQLSDLFFLLPCVFYLSMHGLRCFPSVGNPSLQQNSESDFVNI